jgi:MoxR-like ATPase
MMDQYQHPENRKPMEQVLYEVKKVIVGQDHLLERMVVALLARGPRPWRLKL